MGRWPIIEVNRVAEKVAPERKWRVSLDFNEQCPNEDYVLDLIERIERLSRPALDRVQYIEQPTPRDLTVRTEMTVHRIARLRPIVIDESLTDLESLRLARQRGYTGIALKACKGQSECLLMAAAASHHQMFTCVQDLTCIGGSFLHSASLASRLPGVAAIEGNGRQYCPAGNEAYMASYAPIVSGSLRHYSHAIVGRCRPGIPVATSVVWLPASLAGWQNSMVRLGG